MLIFTGCFSLAVAKTTPSGPTTRDQSHIKETLRLATAEPSREFVGESYSENKNRYKYYLSGLYSMYHMRRVI